MTFQKGHPSYLTEEAKRNISESNRGHIKYQSKERSKKISEALRGRKTGRPAWNRGMKGHFKHTEQHKAALMERMSGENNPSKRLDVRKKITSAQTGVKRINYSGDKHHAWRGGITPENERARKSLEYRIWRNAVFERDNWTCRKCGVRGVVLHADHIKMFAFHPELRYAIDNGQTLCVRCHLELPTTKIKKHICCV